MVNVHNKHYQSYKIYIKLKKHLLLHKFASLYIIRNFISYPLDFKTDSS